MHPCIYLNHGQLDNMQDFQPRKTQMHFTKKTLKKDKRDFQLHLI